MSGIVTKTRVVISRGGPRSSTTISHYAEVSYWLDDKEYTVEVTTGSGAILHHYDGQAVVVAVNEDRPEKGVVVSGPMFLLKGFVLVFGVGLTIVGSVILPAKFGLVTVHAV